MSKIKLFCIPFAGGSAVVFNQWRPLLSRDIELKPVELAGRGRRIREPLYGSLEQAVDDLFKIIAPELSQGPYALLGHSMGSLLAFELYYKIKARNLPEPVHAFFSGRGAPSMPTAEKKKYHLLPEDEFKKEMIELGGTSREFFEHPELVEVFLPLMRQDLKIHEHYRFQEKPGPLICPVTVLNGKKDPETTIEEAEAWRQHSGGNFTIYHFEGGHFFLTEQFQAVVKIINQTLIPVSA